MRAVTEYETHRKMRFIAYKLTELYRKVGLKLIEAHRKMNFIAYKL